MEKKIKFVILALVIATLTKTSIIAEKGCGTVGCPEGKNCQNGVCVDLVEASTGFAVLDTIKVCPGDAKYKIINCPKPRPTEQDCPPIYYIREPDPQICGVYSDGTKVNFVRDCQACKDKNIQYFFNKPCSETPFVCEGQQKCQNDYCKGHSCKVDSDCPYNWQSCSEGKCIDPCQKLKCASCKYGECLYTKPNGLCIFDSDCEKNWSCVGFQCVDMCLSTPCPPAQDCIRGSCTPSQKNQRK